MKKVLATVLALVMALALCTTSWAAETDVAKIGNTGYATLAEAITAVSDGDTITLSGNIEVSQALSVSKKVTIDLNGQTITGKNGEYGCRVFNVVAGGSLTLTGSGTITTEGNNDDTFPVESSVIRVGDNTNGAACGLVVGKDVKIIAPASYGVAVFGTNTKQTLEVNGTVTSDKACAISGNGSAGFTATEITINDGAEITSNDNVAIYHPQAGTLTVKAATITGRGGIEIKSGTASVDVAGANIKATGSVDHTGNNDGTSSRGYAIAVVENPGYKGAPSAVIQNGDFVGAMGILKDGEVSAEEKKGNLAIHAGSFTVNVNDYVTGNTPVASNNGTYYVGETTIQNAANNLSAGQQLKIEKGTVTINGAEYSAGGNATYTKPSSGGYYYYYYPTTDTKADDTKGSPKTFDAGVGIYAVTAVLSVTGMAWTAKKRGN